MAQFHVKVGRSYSSLLLLLFGLSGCTQLTPTAMMVRTARKLELIPIVIGDTPPTAANAIVGTWQVSNFTISSDGNLSGKFQVALNTPVDFPNYQDVLVIQVSAHYVFPQYGDTTAKLAGDFIPIKSSQSTSISAAFDIVGKFAVPPMADGELPLQHIQVTMVWYRLTRCCENGYGGYAAEIGYPENAGDQPWMGTPILNKTESLKGKIDTNIRGGLDYSKWFAENISLPTNTPVAYPAPLSTPSTKPYPAAP